MMLSMLKSKIHRAYVTQAELNYVGSLTLDPELMQAAGILPHERVQVLNLNTGGRFETYAIKGKPGDRTVCLNGPAARLGQVGDCVIVLTYALMHADEAASHVPTVVQVDAENRITAIIREETND